MNCVTELREPPLASPFCRGMQCGPLGRGSPAGLLPDCGLRLGILPWPRLFWLKPPARQPQQAGQAGQAGPVSLLLRRGWALRAPRPSPPAGLTSSRSG